MAPRSFPWGEEKRRGCQVAERGEPAARGHGLNRPRAAGAGSSGNCPPRAPTDRAGVVQPVRPRGTSVRAGGTQPSSRSAGRAATGFGKRFGLSRRDRRRKDPAPESSRRSAHEPFSDSFCTCCIHKHFRLQNLFAETGLCRDRAHLDTAVTGSQIICTNFTGVRGESRRNTPASSSTKSGQCNRCGAFLLPPSLP